MLYFIYRTISMFIWCCRLSVHGIENIPNGPCLLLANHEGGETGKLAAAFRRKLRFTVAKTVYFRPLIMWYCRLLGMLPIAETLANLTKEEQQRIVSGARWYEKKSYQKVLKRTESSNIHATGSIRKIVDVLRGGETVVIYPQGVLPRTWSGRPALGGYILVARRYERISGEALTILPVEVRGRNIVIRSPFTVQDLPPYSRETGESQSSFYGRLAMQMIHGHSIAAE